MSASGAHVEKGVNEGMRQVIYIDQKEASGLDKLLRWTRQLGFTALATDVRGFPLANLSWAELESARRALEEAGVRLALYGLPVLGQEPAALAELMPKLAFLDAECMLYFEDVDPLGEAGEALCAALALAKGLGMKVLLANRATPGIEGRALTGTLAARLAELGEDYDLGLLFDPLAFLEAGLMPLHQGYFPARYKAAIAALRLRDGLGPDPERPGEPLRREGFARGHAQLLELVSINKARSFVGDLIFDCRIDASDGEREAAALAENLEEMRRIRALLGRI